jgi:threonine dehydrogenase-like Zn-dependent dehydrogenase
VAGVVRRPDPEPCPACAAGEFDFCRNGRYTERGIKEINGYGAERWTVEAEYAVKVDPALGILGVLVEPASVLAKAWEQIERIGSRAHWDAHKVLVTGAGPIGLFAALMGVQRGYEVHVLDRAADGPKPELVRALGGVYHHDGLEAAVGDTKPDIVIEATGVGQLVFDAMRVTASTGILCLTGLSPAGRDLTVDAGALNRDIVLENDVVFGSVNANHRHYAMAADSLRDADRDWLDRLVTRQVPLERWREALERRPDDIKVLLDFGR